MFSGFLRARPLEEIVRTCTTPLAAADVSPRISQSSRFQLSQDNRLQVVYNNLSQLLALTSRAMFFGFLHAPPHEGIVKTCTTPLAAGDVPPRISQFSRFQLCQDNRLQAVHSKPSQALINYSYLRHKTREIRMVSKRDSICGGRRPVFRCTPGICHTLFSRNLSHIPDQVEPSKAKPPLFDAEENHCVEQKNQPCTIATGNSKLLLKKIRAEEAQNKQDLDENHLRQKFNKNFKPQLVSKCLILPEKLDGKSTEFLHHQYHLVNGIPPQYISAYELTMQSIRIVDEEEWSFFWNQLLSNRTFIVNDWGSNICNIQTMHYDYGMPGFFKGEIDASFHDGKNGKDGKATVSFVIWREDKIICSEVYRDVECPSIHAAEAYAALALFFKCFEEGIENLLLWTDNADIHGAINGSLTVRHNNEIRHILWLLGCISKRFKKLRSMCKPRELMFLANELTQDRISVARSINMEEELKKWAYQLSGKAVFRLSLAGPASQTIKKFEIRDYKRKEQTVYFMEVDHDCKFDALAEIKETLRPSDIYIAIDRFDEKPIDFQNRVKEMAGTNIQGRVKDGCTILHCATKHVGDKRLLFVVDAALSNLSYDFLDCFTIILVTPGERPLLDRSIKELSALSYVYFNGVKYGPKDKQQKLKQDLIGK